jgi:hypothetical protein
VTVVSAVRSQNVPRVSKSYESFGDRFTSTVIDDLATSDLSQAVEGVTRESPLSSKAENTSGVDAIIHVAYPFTKTGRWFKSSSRFVVPCQFEF